MMPPKKRAAKVKTTRKKPVSKRPAAKEPAAKKPAAKTPAAKKPAAQTVLARKPAAGTRPKSTRAVTVPKPGTIPTSAGASPYDIPYAGAPLGAHVSTSGGVATAPPRGVDIGATAIQLFTKQANQWKERLLDDAEVAAFRQ